jgi:succinyl-CoA synthetase (ADP-forming) beta subunit (EC 6.2.1.5)
VLSGGVATTVAEAREIAERLGGRVVVKAQVKVGGRGKAGGVKLADDVATAAAHAEKILGMDIKGHKVHKVMLTVTADIAEEYYLRICSTGRPLVPVHRQRRRRHGHRAGRGRDAGAGGEDPDRRQHRGRRGQGS